MLKLLVEVVGEKVFCFDNKGDIWYDLIFVVYKLICGLNFDVVLYWFVRMIVVGCDLFYIVCRLLVIVLEDVGNVDLCVM